MWIFKARQVILNLQPGLKIDPFAVPGFLTLPHRGGMKTGPELCDFGPVT